MCHRLTLKGGVVNSKRPLAPSRRETSRWDATKSRDSVWQERKEESGSNGIEGKGPSTLCR